LVIKRYSPLLSEEVSAGRYNLHGAERVVIYVLRMTSSGQALPEGLRNEPIVLEIVRNPEGRPEEATRP